MALISGLELLGFAGYSPASLSRGGFLLPLTRNDKNKGVHLISTFLFLSSHENTITPDIASGTPGFSQFQQILVSNSTKITIIFVNFFTFLSRHLYSPFSLLLLLSLWVAVG
jgi:hypothetical protein